MKLVIKFGREEKVIVNKVEDLVFDLHYTKVNGTISIELTIDFIVKKDYEIFIAKLIELNLTQVINRILGAKQ